MAEEDCSAGGDEYAEGSLLFLRPVLGDATNASFNLAVFPH